MNKKDLVPNSANLPFIEELYAAYIRNPSSVSPAWRRYFMDFFNGEKPSSRPIAAPTFKPRSLFNPPTDRRIRTPTGITHEQSELASLQDRVNQLIRNYRFRGHMIAKIDPLGLPRPTPHELEPEYFEFTQHDLDRVVTCEAFQFDGPLALRQVIERLRNTYCRSIGIEYMHIDDLSVRRWLQRRMEGTENRFQLSREEQLRILTRLTDAVTFEEFVRKKFIGAKTFSLEGCESLIPLLDLTIEKAGNQGTKEIVLGMAHRGRLNVLCNIMGKHPSQIFREFVDSDPHLYTGRGDVKYHLGYSNDWQTAGGEIVHLSLCFNPSHLEFVNPVVLGRIRAKQDRVNDKDRRACMGLLIHGDAAFAAEGVVQESLNLSQLDAYSTGGTLHVILNNQIGFTTSAKEGRSSAYATDIAKMLQIPIFHVNGEDPEAVAQVVQLAMDFRSEFQRDVVIDMYGYRRLGHNEGDEPSFTQPVLYRAIEKRKPVREGYLDHLLQLNEITREEADEISENRRQHLEKALTDARSEHYTPPREKVQGIWSRSSYYGGCESEVQDTETGVDKETLVQLLQQQTKLPGNFHPHPKIKKLLEHRLAVSREEEPIDWATAESLAFASLAIQGNRVRLSGQDSGRGTFSQRHAILVDVEDGHRYLPLRHLTSQQAPVNIYNSPLSETGVLAYEYGYSLDCPDALVLWEAQFGDFVNAAQVIVDQFIASAEDKWRRLSGIVLLLPHGFEGQGPEHSSARLERFLTLAAEDNIQIAYPTTPAQYFHVLRRQVLRPWRKPMVLMTPKSLLRHPKVSSSFDELAQGTFQRILPDTAGIQPSQVKRILVCSGKIYYELEKRREELQRNDIALLRLEELYPLQLDQLKAQLAAFHDETPVFWVQEEPENMGAWRFLRIQLGDRIFDRLPLSLISRPASASPATGSASSHKKEQEHILQEAFAGSGGGD